MNQNQQSIVDRNIRRAFNLFRSAIPSQHHDDIQLLMLKLAVLDDLLSSPENRQIYTGMGQTPRTHGISNCIFPRFYKPETPNDVVANLVQDIVKVAGSVLFSEKDQTCWAAIMAIEAFGYHLKHDLDDPSEWISVVISGNYFSLEYTLKL